MRLAFSIRTKVLLVACGSAAVALLLACVGFALNGVHTLRAAKVRRLGDQARMVAYHAPPVLTARNKSAGERLLASLHSDTTVEVACILDDEMRIVASYGMISPNMVPVVTASEGHRFVDFGHIEVMHPVLVAGEDIGSVYIRANTQDLQKQVQEFARIAGYVLAFAMAVAIFLSMGMQRGISRPILALTQAAQRIAIADDYSIRVDTEARAELYTLQTAFNRMLDHIEKSECELQAAHNDLEARVVSRTQELSLEIAERKRVQEDLERAKEVAESANKAKSEFLANVSHEIRTPLNGIIGFTDLMLKVDHPCTPEEQQDYLQTIRRCGVHLLELINDVLDLSKIEAGRLEVEQIAFSPHEVIADVVTVLRVRAHANGLTLSYQWTTGLPERIENDPARLRQLLMNLIGNAIKFTERGGISVVVGLTTDSTPPKLKIDVIDTGIGIPSDKLETIFEPFTQADTSVTRRFGGTGLGLAISRRIAKAMGGSVTVKSTEGQGSCFSVVIGTGDLKNVRVLTALPTISHEPAPSTQKTLQLPRTNVLVVDDGDTNRKLMRRILQRAGANVVLAENGAQAVQAMEHHPFHIVLMDMQMPVMDGYSAARRLRDMGYDLPIIAITAHAMKDDEEKCKSAGCTGYVSKPIDGDQLLAVLHSHLARQPEFGGTTPSRSSTPVADDTAAMPTAGDTLEPPAKPGSPIYSTLPMDDAEFREIVQEFIDRLHAKLDAMNLAHAAGRTEEVLSLAHWLKGAGGSAGFADLTDTARSLEAAARQNQSAESQQLIDQLFRIRDRLAMPPLTPEMSQDMC
jgi:signal transduction histidine kinase/ActR/RegA family two-component response regulator/HPt (histidine-containing phosphotransfer) domain-containing protein